MNQMSFDKTCLPPHVISELKYSEALNSYFKDQDSFIWLVTSKHWRNTNLADAIRLELPSIQIAGVTIVGPNPTATSIMRIAPESPGRQVDAIIALGGGSVIDTAKVLGSYTVLHDKSSPKLISLKESLKRRESNIPVIAIPSTAGTGAEVTPFATIWDTSREQKLSIEDASLLPALVILDPCLLKSLDNDFMLYASLDALSHALESIWNLNKTQESERAAKSSLIEIVRSLSTLTQNPTDRCALQQLQMGSVLAGLAIAQTKTAIAHAISYPLTLCYGIPHGLAAAFTLSELIDIHITQTQPNEDDTKILLSAKELLKAFKLPAKMAQYASLDKIISAYNATSLNPDRIGNYAHHHAVKSPIELVSRSLRFYR